MNKVFQLIIILSFISRCSAPTPINYDEELTEINGIYYLKNTNKVYSGKFFTLFRDGVKKNEGTLKDGKLNGVYTFWYESGEKKGEVSFKNGKENGRNTLWYRNGQKLEEGIYNDGKRYGKRVFWNSNGTKKKEVNYNKDGRPRWNSY